MEHILIYEEWFDVVEPVNWIPKPYLYGKTKSLYECYDNPTDTLKKKYNLWIEWLEKGKNYYKRGLESGYIKNFGIYSYNDDNFKLCGDYYIDYCFIGNIVINRSLYRLYTLGDIL